MLYRPLGATGMQVSLPGYGGWALGAKGWPGVNEAEAARTLEEGIALGINFFDTAPIYGFGRSEQLLGDVLAGMRPSVLIATKCGLVWNERGGVRHDLTRDSIYREIEQSLRRLKTDYIDLYQLHWPDRRTPLKETLEAVCRLQKQGAVRHIGLCNFPAELTGAALSMADIASVQQPYNMLQREAEADILPLCRSRNLGFICYSPLAQGLLAGNFTGDFKPGSRDIRRLNPLFRNRETFLSALQLVQGLGGSPAAQALRFAARQEGVSTVLVSMTRRSHLRENCKILGSAEP